MGIIIFANFSIFKAFKVDNHSIKDVTFGIFQKELFYLLHSNTNLALDGDQITAGINLWKDIIVSFQNKDTFGVFMES